MLQATQRDAFVVESDAVRELGPWKGVDFLDVVQELDELECACANLFHRCGLLDRIEIVAHVVDAAALRRDDVVETAEVAHEQCLGVGRLGTEAVIGHRLPAAGLVARIHDLVAEPLQKFEGRDPNFREEGVDETGDEQPDSHSVPPQWLPRLGCRDLSAPIINRP
jgi:hypothetical protein